MWVDAVSDFDGKTFQSIAKGEVDLDTEDEKKAAEAEREEKEKEFGELLTWLTETLSDDIKETRLSTRLTTSAACIVGDAFSMSPTLEKMYKASGQPVPHSKRILELNPERPLVSGLREAQSANDNAENLTETAQLLYGMALLAE